MHASPGESLQLKLTVWCVHTTRKVARKPLVPLAADRSQTNIIQPTPVAERVSPGLQQVVQIQA